jgi:hypothetical protein
VIEKAVKGMGMAQFAGTYRLVAADNFDEYLKALGVASVTRKLANDSTPTIQVTVTGDTWSIKIETTTFYTTQLDFTLGQEFTWEFPDGRSVTSTITQDGDTLAEADQIDQTQVNLTWTFADTELTVTYEAGGVTATRVFTRS